MNNLFNKLIYGQKYPEKIKVIDRRQEAIKKAAREQFLKLKEKGLSIPIFTL